MSKQMRGMTLLELVVVLAILAVVTGIAVASFTAVEDQTRFDATTRQVEEVEIAILGERGLRNANNQPLINGFLSDMGRLPLALDVDNDGVLQPSELWSPVTQETPSVVTLVPHSMQQATAPNIPSAFNLSSISPPQTLTAIPATSDVADSMVFLGSGWRGPYLRLGVGSQSLLDAWGNRMDSLKADNTAVAPNDFVFGVLSRGSDFPTIGVTTGYGRDQSFNVATPSDRYRSNLTVSVRALSDNSTPSQITVQLFVPNGTGKIRCFRMSQTVVKVKGALLSLPFMFPAESSDGTNNYSVCSPGTRVIRVYNGNATTVLVPPLTHGTPLTFTMTPGDNHISLELP